MRGLGGGGVSNNSSIHNVKFFIIFLFEGA